MKKIYFDLHNGEVGDPFGVLPKYMAIVKRGKVKEIYTCFRVQNIAEKGGQEWVDEQLSKEAHDWSECQWLMDTLSRYIMHPKHWFKDSNHTECAANRFIWIRFYKKED